MDSEILTALIRVLPFMLVPVGLYVGWRREAFSTSDLFIQPPNSYRNVVFWVIGFLIYVAAFESVLYYFDLLHPSPWKYDLAPSIIRIAGMIVLAPIAEELIFRGLILFKLRDFKIPKHAAIMLQGLFFVAMHSFSGLTLQSSIGMIQIFVDSLIFAYAMYHTRSIYTAILLHAIGNLAAVIEQFYL